MKDGETAASITTMSVRTEGNLSYPGKKNQQQPHSLFITTSEAPASLKKKRRAGWEIFVPQISTESDQCSPPWAETQYPAFQERR